MNPLAAGLLAWLVPGAGHLMAGARRKGLIFLVVLGAMFVVQPLKNPEFWHYVRWAVGDPVREARPATPRSGGA